MSATTATVGQLLNHFYVDKLYEALSQEAFIADFAMESPYPWQGDRIEVTIHTGRNDTGQFISEGGALPVAGEQGYAKLQITTSEYAHQFSFSTRAMVAGKNKSPEVVAGIVDSEMEGLKKDAKQRIDCARIFGGPCKALLNEHKPTGVTVANWAGAAGNASLAVNFEAWFDRAPRSNPFVNCVSATPATWVRVRLLRADTLAEIAPTLAGGGTVAHVFVTGFSLANASLELRVAGDGVGGSFFDTVVTAIGDGIVLRLHTLQSTINGLNIGTLVPVTAALLEPIGILGNLGDPTHWTVDRTTATGGDNVALQSFIKTVSAVVGTHARAILTASRLQAIMDVMLDASDSDNDDDILPVMSPLARSVYLAALTATTQYQVVDGGGKKGVDLNPDGKRLELLGHRIKTAHNWTKGCIGFIRKGTWYLAEYEKPMFVPDENGNVFRLVPGFALMAGLYQMWDQFFTPEPNKQALLCGTNI